MDNNRLFSILSEVCVRVSEDTDTSGMEVVSLGNLSLGVYPELAGHIRAELVQILEEYPQPDRLAVGPSYIELGAYVGGQNNALLLLAVGKVVGFWNIITPETVGISGEEALDMIAVGFLFPDGYRPD